jgi:hypothetical protein
VGDEIDELDFGFNTRSIVVDMTNLDSPVLKTEYVGMTPAIDHNGYTLNNEFYLANYRAGLRLMNTSDINNGNVNEIAYFDTYPENNNAEFNGAWSNYPYFASGNILVSDIDRGLFIVRKNAALGTVQHEINKTSLSPNPASFNVTVRSSVVITTIEVFDAVGKRVKSYRDIGANDYEFGVTDLQSGFYLVKINESTTQKLMIR